MINKNGILVEDSELKISINNRGLQYGDAIFETLRVSNGKIFFWEDHYFRLMASMRILRMEIPMSFSMEYLENEVLKTVNWSKESTSYSAKIYINRKEGGKYTPEINDIDFFITSSVLDTSFFSFEDKSYVVDLYKDYYVYANLLSNIKSTNRIVNVLGSIYAKENNYNNCLLLNEKKQIIEALNANLFLVIDNKIITPPLESGCLNGIIRKQIITICNASKKYELVEKAISPFELQKADELFITNVIIGIQPISNYRKKRFDTTISKELIQLLNVKARLS